MRRPRAVKGNVNEARKKLCKYARCISRVHHYLSRHFATRHRLELRVRAATFECRVATRTNHLHAKQQTCSLRLISPPPPFSTFFRRVPPVETMRNVKRASYATSLIIWAFTSLSPQYFVINWIQLQIPQIKPRNRKRRKQLTRRGMID